MSDTERLSCISVELSGNHPFALKMHHQDRNCTLSIVDPKDFGHDTSPETQDLMRTVMLAHLVAPHFPEIIETNFSVKSSAFLNELYKYYGHDKPVIRKSEEQVTPSYESVQEDKPVIDTASAHSGGLDSVYRIAKSLINNEKVLAVHIHNLNAKGNFSEAKASQNQCEQLGVPYQKVRLINSSGNTGFDTMRTRDMLLALMVAITAKPYHARKVLVEGGMSPDPHYHFSENSLAWVMFNNMLHDSGLNLDVVGIDPGDVETVGEIIKIEKELKTEILPLVQNCFSSPFQIPHNRKKWERETPVLAENSPQHWCGSCLKCRRMSLGRIFYQDPKLKNISKNEVSYFVNDTFDWMHKYPHNKDLISDSFRQHLQDVEASR